nr:hypothetical protein [Tanacetum cinerariifolium]
MSSDDASSAVTYMSISSDSDGPSWGITLMDAGELPEMDLYEEATQQGHAVQPLSPAYVPDPMELEDHVPVYVPEPVYPVYLAPSDDDIPVEDQPLPADSLPAALSPGYVVDSDPKEDPEEDHANYLADGGDDNDDSSDDDDTDDDDD